MPLKLFKMNEKTIERHMPPWFCTMIYAVSLDTKDYYSNTKHVNPETFMVETLDLSGKSTLKSFMSPRGKIERVKGIPIFVDVCPDFISKDRHELSLFGKLLLEAEDGTDLCILYKRMADTLKSYYIGSETRHEEPITIDDNVIVDYHMDLFTIFDNGKLNRLTYEEVCKRNCKIWKYNPIRASIGYQRFENDTEDSYNGRLKHLKYLSTLEVTDNAPGGHLASIGSIRTFARYCSIGTSKEEILSCAMKSLVQINEDIMSFTNCYNLSFKKWIAHTATFKKVTINQIMLNVSHWDIEFDVDSVLGRYFALYAGELSDRILEFAKTVLISKLESKRYTYDLDGMKLDTFKVKGNSCFITVLVGNEKRNISETIVKGQYTKLAHKLGLDPEDIKP